MIYGKDEIRILKIGGQKLAQIVEVLTKNINPGRNPLEIDKLAHSLMVKAGGRPSFLNHDGFPASVCVSVNNEVVHGIPTTRRFKIGDIVGLDAGLNFKRLNTDMAVTVPVGRISQKKAEFINAAKKALALAIEKAIPGSYTGILGKTIQNFVEDKGFSVVRELSGHGVGRELHEEPTIFNFDNGKRGEKLIPGMVLAIEPIINLGRREVETSIDGWRVKTKDKSVSAHFEHTILITKTGNKVLTASKANPNQRG